LTFSKSYDSILENIGEKMNKVYIYVQGGVVQTVRAEEKDIEVVVFDVDNEKEEKSSNQIDKEWNAIVKKTSAIY
jgi:hypothetical protein